MMWKALITSQFVYSLLNYLVVLLSSPHDFLLSTLWTYNWHVVVLRSSYWDLTLIMAWAYSPHVVRLHVLWRQMTQLTSWLSQIKYGIILQYSRREGQSMLLFTDHVAMYISNQCTTCLELLHLVFCYKYHSHTS